VHGLDQVVGDIQGHHRHGMAVGVQVQRSRLAVDLGVADAAYPEPLGEGPELAEQPDDPLAPVDRAKAGGRLAAAVAVNDYVGGQQADQSLGVLGLDRLRAPATAMKPESLDKAWRSGRYGGMRPRACGSCGFVRLVMRRMHMCWVAPTKRARLIASGHVVARPHVTTLVQAGRQIPATGRFRHRLQTTTLPRPVRRSLQVAGTTRFRLTAGPHGRWR
jgi:hypothetical protein